MRNTFAVRLLLQIIVLGAALPLCSQEIACGTGVDPSICKSLDVMAPAFRPFRSVRILQKAAWDEASQQSVIDCIEARRISKSNHACNQFANNVGFDLYFVSSSTACPSEIVIADSAFYNSELVTEKNGQPAFHKTGKINTGTLGQIMFFVQGVRVGCEGATIWQSH